MKNRFFVLGLFICIGATSISSPPLAIQHSTGEEQMKSLRGDYENGSEAQWLQRLDEMYLDKLKENELDSLLEMRKIPEPEGSLIQLAEQWKTLHQQLQDERNEELISVFEGTNNLLSRQVESILNPIPQEAQEAIAYLQGLRFKTPDQAQNQDEKLLIDLDLATECKMDCLHDLSLKSPETLKRNLVEMQAILKMDLLKQMQKAASSFSQSELQSKISLASHYFDQSQAQAWDEQALLSLAKAKQKSLGPDEKKVLYVLSTYALKKQDLYQEKFIAKRDQLFGNSADEKKCPE